MITDQSTDDLLATRRKLAEVLSRHGSNPEDWLVSAEALSAPRQERIVRLYAELSENTDYFQRLANRAAAVPRTEPALRTYGPTDRDIHLLEELAQLSKLHEIQLQAARRPHHATLVRAYNPPNSPTGWLTPPLGIWCGMTIDRSGHCWESNSEMVTRDGLRQLAYTYDERTTTQAVVFHLTYFKPYPPLLEGWLPGFLRLQRTEWEEKIWFCTWTTFILEWAQRANFKMVGAPRWPLRIFTIYNQHRRYLFYPMRYDINVTWTQDRERAMALTDSTEESKEAKTGIA